MPFPAGWLVPDWPAPAHVRAVCTTRAGGVSQGAYESLNLGDHVGDAPDAVAQNRARFAKEIGARPVFLQQVHGRHATLLDASTSDGTEADGCFTRDRSIACTIMVADCLPVLFTSADGRAVAAAHAGWRGLAGEGGRGVIESVWDAFRSAADGSNGDPSTTLAWLGPCIGPDAFEVGDEVKAAFETHDAGAAAMFRQHAANKWLANLQGLARRRLQALGITRIYGNDGTREWCTVSNPSRFFSHRRDRVSGRFAASIWLA
ncbi:MAG: peptidoglycan editing factor PgeF [Ramlibacter sp.]